MTQQARRCSFCARRIRGDYVEVQGSEGRRYYHYAAPESESPHRHCAAAARHYSNTSGGRSIVYAREAA